MSMTTNALACRTIREGIFELIASQPFTHCITLNSDRELSLPRLRGIFGTFCVKIDRQIHVRDHVRNLPIGDRLNAIAFPEHLATNAHLHVLANLAPLEARHPQPQALTECIRRCWLQSSRGAGSVYLDERRSSGFDRYAAKEANGSDPIYFLSSDYHPH